MGYSGRLTEELLERGAEFGARALSVVDELEKQKRTRRVVDQIAGSGGGAPALLWEASEALSRADFIKTMGWAAKEFSEARYWLRVIGKAGWIPAHRLTPLEDESVQLMKIAKSMIARSRKPPAIARTV